MVRQLVQTLADYPSLAEGLAPPGLLHPSEQARLDTLRVLKRRRDWLLGRWTAKHLVQQYLGESSPTLRPLSQIVIQADPDGAPFAALGVSSDGSSAVMSRLPLSLSISHSGDRSFCALIDEPGEQVGADLEMIEPREPALATQFFAPDELLYLQGVLPECYDAAVTAIWCAKESVLKALRTGLRTDTRWLTCLPAGDVTAHDAWSSFVLSFDARLRLSPFTQALQTLWRREEAYMLALTVLRHPVGEPAVLTT